MPSTRTIAALVSIFLIAVASAELTGCGRGEAHESREMRSGRRGRRPSAPAGVELPARPGPSPVHYVDATQDAGITFVQENGRSEDLFYIELIGSGGAFFDAEGDGDADLYLMNGRRLAGPPQTPEPVNTFYLNDGTGRFTDATAESGLGDPRYSNGVCAADYDNDGDIDVYVTNFDEANGLYRNDGTGRFADVATAAGVAGGPAMVSSCAFGDADGDGWLDLYVGYYADHTVENNKTCRARLRDGSGWKNRYCVPKDYEAIPDVFYRNRGDGTFEDATKASGLTGSPGRTLGVVFSDFDDDGDADLFVACDRSANLYYENVGNGRFREMAMANGTALSEEGKLRAGMGVATGDFDGDERIDLTVTYFENEVNSLLRNTGHNFFEDVTNRSGAARPAFALLGWGTELFDADLDGLLDWVVVNGHVIPDAHLFRKPIAGYEQNNLFFLNRGNALFEELADEAGPGFVIEKVSRGLATADIDADGDLDLLVTNIHERPDLLRNDSPRQDRHWLLVRTIGTRSNRDGIGARLTARLPDRTLVREVRSGQSYMSQSDLRVHFGLGEAEVVPVLDVRWPSGATSRLENVSADQVLVITEPQQSARLSGK